MRALFDDGGKRVDAATPSIPVQVCKFTVQNRAYGGLLNFCSPEKISVMKSLSKTNNAWFSTKLPILRMCSFQ